MGGWVYSLQFAVDVERERVPDPGFRVPVKRQRGRPMLFTDVKALQARIEAYFQTCDQNDQIYTIGRPAEALGMVRQTLLNYEGKPEFLDTIKKAKMRIEARIEEMGLLGKVNPTFAIFWLKNNAGWRDSQHIKSESEVKVTDGLKLSELLISERIPKLREWLKEHQICTGN
jgi:hypothetical protein